MSDYSTGPDGDLGRLIDAMVLQAEAARRTSDLIETRALPLLERIAMALERAPISTRPVEGRSGGVIDFRVALRERRWDDAEAIARDLSRDRPDDPEVAAVVAELERSRGASAGDLRERIAAARRANDPDGAMASRDELARLIEGEPLKEVDRDLVKWLMGSIQRRLRGGTIRADVVELAARVADRFGATTEGASLHAALPTLRRSAGLCPKCAEPYAGLADACPKCLVAPDGPGPAPDAELEEDDIEAEAIAEPIDLNDDRLWRTP